MSTRSGLREATAPWSSNCTPSAEASGHSRRRGQPVGNEMGGNMRGTGVVGGPLQSPQDAEGGWPTS